MFKYIRMLTVATMIPSAAFAQMLPCGDHWRDCADNPAAIESDFDAVRGQSLAPESPETSCVENWRACVDNREFMTRNMDGISARIACERATVNYAPYDVLWPFRSRFNTHLPGDGYPRSGMITLFEYGARANLFDAYPRLRIACFYDLKRHVVTHVSIR